VSLRVKLALLVLGLTTALLGGLGLALGASLRGWADEVVDAELSRRADVLTNEAHQDHGRLELDDDDDLATRGLPFRIEQRDGALLAGSDTWPAGSLSGPGYSTVQSRTGEPVRVLSQTFWPQGGTGPLVLRVAAPLGPIGKLTARFRDGLLLALALAAVLSAAGAALLAQGFTAPLRWLSAQVDALGPRTPEGRLETRGLDPALARLAAAFNALLSRIAAAHEGQRAFVGRASHALRTPLASILTEAEVALRKDRSAGDYQKSLEAIAAATRDAARLTDGLLALTRAESGQPALRERVALDALAQDLARRFSSRAEANGLTLTASAPPGWLLATPDRLREALDALLDNALRYTPRGGSVRFTAQQAGGEVLLEVADSGPGFSAVDRDHAFERFFRGSAAASSGQPGSGLGLSLAKALAEAEGGAVSLSANPGGGAAVLLRFPQTAPGGN
jgi:signal transduction histidine kinase